MSVIQSSEFAIDCTCGEEVADPEEAEISLLLPSALPPFLFREGVVPAAADIGMYLMNRIRLSKCMYIRMCVPLLAGVRPGLLL